jgi:hypothetical protein
LKTEHSIQAQSLIALIFIIAGFFLKYLKLSGFFKFWQFV